MKLGQKVRTIARKAGFKVSVAATPQTATISLINGDVPAFLELCMKKYPKGIMSAEGKSFTFEVSEPWPVKQSEPKVSQPDEPQLQVIPIKNINKITEIPAGYDLVVVEKGQDPVTQGLVLHDFTELGLFSQDVKKPVYSFVCWASAVADHKPAKAKKAPKAKAEVKVKKGDHSKAAENLVNKFDPVIGKELKKEGFRFYHEVTDHTTKTVTYFWDTPRCLRHQDEVSDPNAKWFKNLLTAYNRFEADLSKFITGLEKLGYKFDSHA